MGQLGRELGLWLDLEWQKWVSQHQLPTACRFPRPWLVPPRQVAWLGVCGYVSQKLHVPRSRGKGARFCP